MADTAKQVARDALVEAASVFSSVELEQATLADMDAGELLAYLEDHGVTVDVGAMEAAAAAALAPDARAISSGMTDSAKREAVTAKVKAQIVAQAKSAARETVRNAEKAAWDLADDRDWDLKFYMWVSVGSGVCDSCHSLHGQVFALDQWEAIGIPGSGATICGERCRCTLVPVDGTDREITRYRNEAAREGLERRTP